MNLKTFAGVYCVVMVGALHMGCSDIDCDPESVQGRVTNTRGEPLEGVLAWPCYDPEHCERPDGGITTDAEGHFKLMVDARATSETDGCRLYQVRLERLGCWPVDVLPISGEVRRDYALVCIPTLAP
ncbi:MAG: hypothetical protein AAFS10_06215 [Myxococcota bacterium]